jgi:uncharacterized membrane protein
MSFEVTHFTNMNPTTPTSSKASHFLLVSPPWEGGDFFAEGMVAFYTAALVGYIVYGNNADPFWYKLAYVANVAGAVMALVAALPGFIDWLNIPSGSQPKRTGVSHMICNVLALGLFATNAWMQCKQWAEAQPTLGLSIPLTGVGFALTMVAGFLGWTLVQKHHVGIDIPGKTE